MWLNNHIRLTYNAGLGTVSNGKCSSKWLNPEPKLAYHSRTHQAKPGTSIKGNPTTTWSRSRQNTNHQAGLWLHHTP